MKYLLSTVFSLMIIAASQTSFATETIARLHFKEETKEETKAKTKKVCVDQIQKNGSKKQVCKEIKIHKKLEGTPVPPAKK
jgi:hypothetical protein